jgi:hypothetical protein
MKLCKASIRFQTNNLKHLVLFLFYILDSMDLVLLDYLYLVDVNLQPFDQKILQAQQLIQKGKAYHCFCSAERLASLRADQEAHHLPTMYDGLCRSIAPDESKRRVASGEKHVIRLKTPK